MKKSIYLISLLLVSFVNAQNTYDVFIIKRDNNNGTISTLDVARSSGNVQNQLQKRYDYNDALIRKAINDISGVINNLDYPTELKSNINSDFNNYISVINNQLQKNRNTILDDSAVRNLIDYLYQSVNNSINVRVHQYNEQISNKEKNDDFVFYFNKGYYMLSDDDKIVAEINSNRANKKKYDELIKKREIMFQNALPYFEKAFQLNPNDENTKAILKMTYELLGQPEKIKTLE